MYNHVNDNVLMYSFPLAVLCISLHTYNYAQGTTLQMCGE